MNFNLAAFIYVSPDKLCLMYSTNVFQWTKLLHQCILIIIILVPIVPIQLFLLEEQRERKYDFYARKLQKAFRRYNAHQYYLKLKEQGKNRLQITLLS